MRKLLDFIVGKRHWFLFLLLEVIAFALVYRNNAYQRNVMLSSANVVTGHLSSLSGSVMAYLNLRELNHELTERNGALEMEVLRLQDQLEVLAADTAAFHGYIPDTAHLSAFPYSFISAEVVSNSVSRLSNYITLNRGALDGVAQDMGVVSDRGVVGIVSTVSDHYAVVIPLLNPKSRLSCKLLRSRFFGTLAWDGRDVRFASLEELPRHVEFAEGDTVVTSGYSAIFPAGLMVGTVERLGKQDDNNFYALDIRLATDFATLSNVRVIRNYTQAEHRLIQQEASEND